MGLLAVQYRLVPEAPVLVASNREEYYDRQWLQPSIQSGKPRILCGIDEKTGGTWLGVNQHGMFVGITARQRRFPVIPTKSRGVLCRELLRSNSAREGVDTALEELSTERYDGVNIIIADGESGWIVHSDDDHEVLELEEGLTIVAGGDANDLRDERVAMARSRCKRSIRRSSSWRLPAKCLPALRRHPAGRAWSTAARIGAQSIPP